MSSPRGLLSVPSSSQTSNRVKLVRNLHHSRRHTVVLREFIIMSANRNTAIAQACEVVSILAPQQLCAPTYCSKNQVVLHFLKCLFFIFVFATCCVWVSWRTVLLIVIQHYYGFFKWNTNLMQHCAGFISAESLYMFRAQAPIIRSI